MTTTTTPTATVKPEHFTRVNNDVNGNPRYVLHFPKLLTEEEGRDYSHDFVTRQYSIALNRAKKIGGRKFHNKQYGGGILFHANNLPALCEKINNLINQ